MPTHELIKTEDEIIKITIEKIHDNLVYIVHSSSLNDQFTVNYEEQYHMHIVLTKVLRIARGYLTTDQVKRLISSLEEIISQNY